MAKAASSVVSLLGLDRSTDAHLPLGTRRPEVIQMKHTGDIIQRINVLSENQKVISQQIINSQDSGRKDLKKLYGQIQLLISSPPESPVGGKSKRNLKRKSKKKSKRKSKKKSKRKSKRR